MDPPSHWIADVFVCEAVEAEHGATRHIVRQKGKLGGGFMTTQPAPGNSHGIRTGMAQVVATEKVIQNNTTLYTAGGAMRKLQRAFLSHATLMLR